MITRGDAELLVESWAVHAARKEGGDWTGMLEEFELGYVVWVKPPDDATVGLGAAPRQVIDRDTGEITTWGSLPAPMVMDDYRRHRETYPVVPPTIDPVATIRRRATRPDAPNTAMHLMLAHDRRLRIAYGAKGDQELNHHPVVREWLGAQPLGHLNRGAERHAEVIMLSDVLHANDVATGGQTSLDEARRLFSLPLELTPWRVRAGLRRPVSALHCASCAAIMVHVGLHRPSLTDQYTFREASITARNRPDFPEELRPFIPAVGYLDHFIDRETGLDSAFTMRPWLLTRPPAIQEMALHYFQARYEGSSPGEAHRIDRFSVAPTLRIHPEIAEEFGRFLGVPAFVIGERTGPRASLSPMISAVCSRSTRRGSGTSAPASTRLW